MTEAITGQGHRGAGAVADVLRPHAEVASADELAALEAFDAEEGRPRPPQWRLSPWAVVTYLVGGTLPDGTVVSPKYIGSRRLMEVAVATLATDRALLLLGLPGTAKSWVSEHLAAAVSGDSTLLVQGTSGTGRVFSLSTVINASCTSDGMRVSSSTRAMRPSRMATMTGEATRAAGLGPSASSRA